MPNLLHISDLHFGAENPVALLAVERYAAKHPIDAVIVSGDLTQRGRPIEFAAAAEWLGRFHMPVVATPGNHDTSYYNLYKRAFRPFKRYARMLESVAEISLATPRLFVATLNTARGWQLRRNWALGSVSRRQLQTAAALIATADPGALRLLVCHHPLATPPSAPLPGETRRGREAAETLARMGIDLVLSGHLHTPFALPLPHGDGATWSIGAGTLSQRERGCSASFTVLHLGDAQPSSQAFFIDDTGLLLDGPKCSLQLRPRRNSSRQSTLSTGA